MKRHPHERSVTNEDIGLAPSTRFDHGADGEGEAATHAVNIEALETAWMAAIKSSVWPVLPVRAEPTIILTGWFVFQMPAGSCHLAGRNMRQHEG
jgi:hypothetical protein